MKSFILLLLSLSLSGSLIALILFAIKPFTQYRFPKSWQYYIWLVVLLRLLVPVAADVNVVGFLFESVNEYIQQTYFSNINIRQIDDTEPMIIDLPAFNNHKPEIKTQSDTDFTVARDIDSSQNTDLFWLVLIVVWICGALFLFCQKAYDYLRFNRNIRLADGVVYDQEMLSVLDQCRRELGIAAKLSICTNPLATTPMLIGVFQSEIVIPESRYTPTDLKYIVLHELAHYKRKDLLVKWFAQMVFCIHWFNPFIYTIVKEISKACELSCDESVIKTMDAQEKQGYGNVLIDSVSNGIYQNNVASTTLCEDKRTLQTRLTSIMKSGKKSKSMLVFATFVLVLICCGAVSAGAFYNRDVFEAETDVSTNNAISNTKVKTDTATEADEPYLISSENSKQEADSRALDIMQRTGNWGYVEPLFPDMTEEGIRAVVSLYIEKTGNTEQAKAAEMYLKSKATEDSGIYVLIKSNHSHSIAESGSFVVKDGEKIILSVRETLEESNVKLFLFDDSGNETVYDIVEGTQIITLYGGEWAWNCSGTFVSGNCEILIQSVTEDFEPSATSIIKDESIIRIVEYTVERDICILMVEVLQPTRFNRNAYLAALHNGVIQIGLESYWIRENKDLHRYEFYEKTAGENLVYWADIPKAGETSIIRMDGSGVDVYENIGYESLELPVDVLVEYIDYDNSPRNRSGKKLMQYLKNGGSYFADPTIPKLSVEIHNRLITQLTEIYVP